jgi:hypothetical protein
MAATAELMPHSMEVRVSRTAQREQEGSTVVAPSAFPFSWRAFTTPSLPGHKFGQPPQRHTGHDEPVSAQIARRLVSKVDGLRGLTLCTASRYRRLTARELQHGVFMQCKFVWRCREAAEGGEGGAGVLTFGPARRPSSPHSHVSQTQWRTTGRRCNTYRINRVTLRAFRRACGAVELGHLVYKVRT